MTRAWRSLVCLTSLVAAGACIDLSVDPDAIGSIEFPPLPSPAVVTNDTLRDASGVAYKLQANVFAADGTPLTDRQVTFFATDTLVRITDDGFVIGDSPVTFGPTELVARLTASVEGLQGLVRELRVVPRPDTLKRQGTADTDTIFYSVIPLASDTSMALAVQLTQLDPELPVPKFVVNYEIRTLNGTVLPATDTTLSYVLVDDGGRVAAVDTTDAGLASRRLRFRIRPGQPLEDSVQVLASVRFRGALVKGAPITWKVLVRPKS